MLYQLYLNKAEGKKTYQTALYHKLPNLMGWGSRFKRIKLLPSVTHSLLTNVEGGSKTPT